MNPAMKRAVAVAVGALVGHFLGWVLAVCWAGASNNLMMGEPEYEAKRGFILLTLWSIIGGSTAAGGLIAFFLSDPAKRARRNS